MAKYLRSSHGTVLSDAACDLNRHRGIPADEIKNFRVPFGDVPLLRCLEQLQIPNVTQRALSQALCQNALENLTGVNPHTLIGKENPDYRNIQANRDSLAETMHGVIENKEVYMLSDPLQAMPHVHEDVFVNHDVVPFREFTQTTDLTTLSDSGLCFGGQGGDPSKKWNDRFKQYNDSGWLGGRTCLQYQQIKSVVVPVATLKTLTKMVRNLVENDIRARGDPLRYEGHVKATYCGNDLCLDCTTALDPDSPQMLEVLDDAEVFARTVAPLQFVRLEGPSTAALWDIEGFDVVADRVLSVIQKSGHPLFSMNSGWRTMKQHRQ